MDKAADESDFSRNPKLEKQATVKLGYSIDEVKRKTITQITKELEVYDAEHPQPPLRSALKKSTSSISPQDDGVEVKKSPRRRGESPVKEKRDESSRRKESPTREKISRTRESPEREKRSTVREETPRRKEGHTREKRHTVREETPKRKENPVKDTRKEARDEHDDIASEGNQTKEFDEIISLHKQLNAKTKFRQQLQRDSDFSKSDLKDWEDSIQRTRDRLVSVLGSPNSVREKWERRQEKLREMERMGLLDSDLAQKWREKQSILKRIIKSVENSTFGSV